MIFFDWIRKQPAITQLEKSLSNFTAASAERMYQKGSDPESRVAGAISVLVLYMVHRYCLGLRKMLGEIPHKLHIRPKSYSYDTLAFEAAAYCHYWLLREDLSLKMDDDLDDSEDEGADEPDIGLTKQKAGDDALFKVLYTAASINAGFIELQAGFPSKRLIGRMLSYFSGDPGTLLGYSVFASPDRGR